MAVDKGNIFLTSTQDVLPYVSGSKRANRSLPIRNDPHAHAELIRQKLNECQEKSLSQKQVAAIRYKDGTYLEFTSAVDCDLPLKSFENRRQGIKLLSVKEDTDRSTKATVYIPSGKESYFLQKVQAYADTIDGDKNPKNNDLVRSIENVRIAVLNSFWIGKEQDIPGTTANWCEIWLRYDGNIDTDNNIDNVDSDFQDCCSSLNIVLDDKRIVFPERLVYMVKADKSQLEGLISVCAYIAEMRRAPESVDFFDSLTKPEQLEWVDDLISRTKFETSQTCICLLDTGLNRLHPLIEQTTSEKSVQSINPDWGTGDDIGHGTEMAGIAVYNDLKGKLLESSDCTIRHKLESVKIISTKEENPPELYGAVTEQAVSLAEISNPSAKRVLCMAVTSSMYNTTDGSPTSWSAAVDSITSGADGSNEKRLFLISAGNVAPQEFATIQYPDANLLHGVESPGQAWNALTVGGYSNDIDIQSDEFDGFAPLADVLELSPYSSTSKTWNKKWPVKPEILLNAGNVATNGTDYHPCPDLSLLTTNNNTTSRFFSTIWGTSSSTAQAAWMAAQLMEEYPSIWPETVRALLVHSSSWTEKMQHQFNNDDKKSTGRRNLLRCCGYGIPDLNKAIQCFDNSVNMIIEGELQPFEKTTGNQPHMKEMDFHRIPWPTELLRDLGEVTVTLKVTLSYFIEPGPGEIGWKDRYRYPSCGLRFDVINSDESDEDFKKRINIYMRGDDKDDHGDGSSGSSRWYLGPESRDVGSIHSDFITTSAVELCNTNRIAVYPVIGWWRERSHLGKCNNKVRYSLVVSLSTPETNVDLYTPIISSIPNTIYTEIPTP